jgi:hypothetical protein
MSNRSYLCGTNLETIYPSFVDKSYDSQNQTIACDVYCVPLLWTALFRPADIVRKTFKVERDEIVAEAPLTRRGTAIRQLGEALPYFNRLFSEEGLLDEYVGFLRQALEAVDFEYVTVELQEIACLTNPEQAYYDMFRLALAGIGSDLSPDAKQRLADIAQFRDMDRFPPARLLLDGLEGEDNDFWNHCRVCGAGAMEAGIGRPVPWERA